MNWVTTNIRIPEDLYMELKMKAARERKSVAAVIREKLAPEKAPKRDKKDKEDYRKVLLSIKGNWFSYKEYERNREQVEERLKRLWNE